MTGGISDKSHRAATQRGFTLVELSIVIVIIGLLIGGVLKGQEMYSNAQVTATIAQTQSYEAATLMFVDAYNAVPGDMPLASNRIPQCAAACDPFAAGAGNYIIGTADWASGWTSQQAVNVSLPATAEEDEVALFWLHLVKAGYITGVTDGVLAGAQSGWGTTNPGAKVGGGFIVGYADGTPTPGQPYSSSTGP